MKLEIELDMNKIDYDAINKQIQEKIEAIDISEFDLDTRIDNITTRIIDNAYSKYIEVYYHDLTRSGNKIVEDVQKEKFTKVVGGIIDDIYSKSKIEELVSELFPSLFVQAMYNTLYNEIKIQTMKTADVTIKNAVNTVIERMDSNGIHV